MVVFVFVVGSAPSRMTTKYETFHRVTLHTRTHTHAHTIPLQSQTVSKCSGGVRGHGPFCCEDVDLHSFVDLVPSNLPNFWTMSGHAKNGDLGDLAESLRAYQVAC